MLRPLLKLMRDGWKRGRFRLWLARLRVEVYRNGGRLRVERAGAAVFDSPPRIDASPRGEGAGTLTLRIGDGAQLGRETTLDLWARRDSFLELGAGAKLMNGVRLELRGGHIALGDRTRVRDFSILKSDGELIVGSEVLISYGCTLHCTERIEIGDHSVLAERVSVTDSDHASDGSETPVMSQPLHVEPVRIARNVLVSSGAVVLRGAVLNENLTVAANAVVPGGDHPAGWLIGGVPAEPIKPLAEGPRRPPAATGPRAAARERPNLEPEPG